jgi:hypothetical protein
VWTFARGERTTVAVNMSDAPQEINGTSGTIALATSLPLEGTAANGSLTLAPWSAVVISS